MDKRAVGPDLLSQRDDVLFGRAGRAGDWSARPIADAGRLLVPRARRDAARTAVRARAVSLARHVLLSERRTADSALTTGCANRVDRRHRESIAARELARLDGTRAGADHARRSARGDSHVA